MITSAQNTQVKNIIKLNQKAKARREQKLFVAEGRKMFLEAPENLIEKIYVAESMLDDEEVMENPYSSQTAILPDAGSSEGKKSTDHGAGRSSGSGQRRNNS